MNTTKPTTLGELQLFKVLQRANLLSYYENFISQGGDDVQQLCEAGEEEFLEIMALVGMACKPLHVRRLQKSLQEWVTRPAIFRGTNIHYLPAQSVSLTSLGIDTRDLPVSSGSQPLLTSPGTPNSGVLQTQEDDLLNRPLSVGGSVMTTPVKSLNGMESVFKMDNTSRKVNSATNKESILDSEIEKDNLASSAIDHQIQKFVENPPTAYEKKEVIKQLKMNREQRDLAIAFEDGNQVLIENLVQEHIIHLKSSDNVTSSRHETLIIDAAVKLCLADERYLLKKSELFTAAEKIAIEVKSKLPSRRRSSTHLHGSCSQSRMQEVNNRLQNIKSQRAELHQKLAEAQNHKNVIKENDCQNILTRISREEGLLLQEKNELEEKLKYESREIEGTSSQREQSSGFSADLADLAKAHNLSFRNIQPSSSHWPLRDNNSDSSSHNGLNGNTKTDRSNPNNSLHTTGLSPPRVVSIDFKGMDGHEERSPQEVDRVKIEKTLNEAPGFPSNSSNIFRTNKRKLSTGSSNDTEAITRKRILGSGTNSE